MENHSRRRIRRESDTDSLASVGSEHSMNRSRSTTPFVLRSHCQHEHKDCPEGHGLEFRSRLSVSPKRSSKKSPRRAIMKTNGRIVKDLANHFQTSCQLIKGTVAASKLAKKFNQTSDYSSAEEENMKNSCMTPIINSLVRPLLPRSAEKTDFTYARSYSYRSEVTPERVIVMPNMTRRSIEANRIPTMGDTYCSPDLNYRSRSTVYTSQTSSNILQRSKACSYGTDYDSDHEIESSNTCYKLLTPSTPRHHFQQTHNYRVLRKLQEYLYSMCWWIYLATCYSLLADTCMLQTKLFFQLRSSCRRNKKLLFLFILFLFLLPPILAAGGWLLSALHGLNSNSNEDNIGSPKPSSPQPFSKSIIPVNLPSACVPSSNSDLPNGKADHLIEIKASVTTLVEKFKEMEEKLIGMATELDMYQKNLILVESLSPCCEKSSPAVISSVIEEKWNYLISEMSEKTGMKVDEVTDLVKSIHETGKHTEDVKKWIENEGKVTHQKLKELQLELTEVKHGMPQVVLSQLEQQMHGLNIDLKSKLSEEMKQIISAEVTKQVNMQIHNGEGYPTRKEVENIVRTFITLYDADKTGMADYALEPAGGVILSTRCTESFNGHRPRLSIWGFSLWSEPNNPRVVIQPGLVPGRCWSFRGFDGYLVVQLSRIIYPTAFSLEHIPKSLAPDNQIDSAPKNFTVYGLQKESDPDGILLGSYAYDQNGDSLQTFPVQNPNHGAYSIVELRVHSNHGNVNYTCLYRFRVHGKVAH